MMRRLWMAGLVLALACGDDDGVVEVDMDTPTGDGGTTPDMPTPDMPMTVSCGDGVVGAGETCDTAIAAGDVGACPSDCDDSDPCTTDTLGGSDCTAACTNAAITDFVDGDMCCPAGATFDDDMDCASDCGNGSVDMGERCDTAIGSGMPGACVMVADCDDSAVCTADTVANDATCAAMCANTEITAADDGTDGCCPAGATNAEDSNCSATCGDGTVDAGETCDTGIAAGDAGACPGTCDDSDPCTVDRLLSPDTCNAECSFPEVAPANDDTCCPTGANALIDNDCSAICGNNVTEPGETCDDGNMTPGDGCDASCQSEGPAPTAMRITQIALADPHVYFFSCALDSTDTANGIFQDAVDDYTLNTVGVWRPLDPAMATTPMDVFPEASCMAGGPGHICMAAGTAVSTTANNMSSGVCYAALPSTTDYPGTPPNEPTNNCFVTDPATVTLNLNGAALLLEDATVAGVYGSGVVTDGVLAGFVSYATAMAVMVPNPVTGGSERLYDLLRGGGCTGATDDDDPRTPGGADEGWWFYINFEAEMAAWSE